MTVTSAQLFDNLERFGSRMDLGDPAIASNREGPKAVYLIDMDGDEKLDVVASNLDGTVSISYGKGGLDFEPAIHVRTGAQTLRGLLCEDMNGDTLPDVATAAPEEGKVHLFFNKGARRFADGVALDTWRTARNLVAGDFNGDGHRDLAVAGRERGVTFFDGDGTGTFSKGATSTELAYRQFQPGFRPVYSMRSVGPTEATRDHLVVTHAETNMAWTIHQSNGELKTGIVQLGHRPHALEVGVVESDDPTATPNLLTADKRSGEIEIRSSATKSEFRTEVAFGSNIIQRIRVRGAPRDLKLADLDGDGWNDLVVVLRNFDRVLTYQNKEGKFDLVSEMPVGSSPRELATGDLNGDGRPDFVAINRRSQDASVLLATEEGDGFSALDQVYPVSGEVAALELHDVNGDGRSDVIQMHRSSGDVSVRLAKVGGQLSAPHYYHMGVLPSGFELRDLNSDGNIDLLTANLGRSGYNPGAVAIRYGNASGSFGDRFLIPTEDDSRIFAVESADFNGDGLNDYAVGYFDCRIAFYEGQTDGSFKYTRTDTFTYESRVMVTGDFDQDGDVDVAGAGYAGDVVVLENEGDLLTTRKAKRRDYRPLSSDKFGTREIQAVDVNEDGDLDLLVGSGKGVMLLTGSDGTEFVQEPKALKGTEFPASSLAEGDYDNDGINDLAVSCRILACVIILKGDGNGGFDPALVVDVPAGEFVRTGDIDGDGLADLAGSGSALWIALSSRPPEAGPAWTDIPTRPPLEQVVINEILASNNRYRFPNSGFETPDAIELFNGSDTAVDIGNWQLRRTQILGSRQDEIREYQLPHGTSIAPSGRLVLFCSNRAGRFHTGFKLPASGARLELLDATREIVDDVTYPPLELNISFARYQDGIPSFRHNILPDIGSANVDNGALEPKVYFDGFGDSPLVPGEPIKMRARANDDVGVIALSLVYRELGQDPNVRSGRAVLYDDGMHEDGEMLDGVFAGELPGMPAGTEIQFYLEAVDLNNKIVTLPGDPYFATTPEQLHQVYTMGVGIPGPSIEISEVVTDNETILFPKAQGTPDYVEIRNTGDETVTLTGLAFGQSFFAQGGDRFVFPDDITLEPREYRVIYFADYPHGAQHAPFPLRKNGDQVFLTGTGPNGARILLDLVVTERMGDDEALFRLGSGGSWYRGAATPGTSNIAGDGFSFNFVPENDVVRFLLRTEHGVRYQIESSRNLEPGSWTLEKQFPGNGFEEVVEISPNERGESYYRIRIDPNNE